MPPSVVLIPEGTTPYDGEWPWKRQLAPFEDENPYAAMVRVRESGVLVQSFWHLEDLWVAGYDRAEALREALEAAKALDVKVEVCWESCLLSWNGQTWQGRLNQAIEVSLGLEPGAGASTLFGELAAGGAGKTKPGGTACSTTR
jgi:hypothetical protein